MCVPSDYCAAQIVGLQTERELLGQWDVVPVRGSSYYFWTTSDAGLDIESWLVFTSAIQQGALQLRTLPKRGSHPGTWYTL